MNSREYQCLIVEDTAAMRHALVVTLARLPALKITEAEDGLDGLRKLAASRFDIVMTDINMPILDGLKLVRRVRMDPAHKDVPIVVITTQTAEADRRRALAIGANAYLAKPIEPDIVIATVRELLDLQD